MAEAPYDVVVLGGGPAGYSAAFRAALHGLKVAMIERDKVGGTCLHRGCIPSKGLLEVAEIYEAISHADRMGITVGQPAVDWPAVQRFKMEPVTKMHAGLSSSVKHRKVDLIEGNGRLGERGTIVVETSSGEQAVTGRNVILAPGSYARTLPGMDADGRLIMTSDDALSSDTLPRSVAIIGAGAIGCEFASLYRSFGTEVTLLEALPRVMPGEDADVSKDLTSAFGRRGIKAMAGVQVTGVDKTNDQVRLTYTKGNKAETIEVESVLVAVGRGAATDGLGLEKWGIKSDRGFLTPDAHGRVADNVYAIGDAATPRAMLAHVGFAQGMAAAERIAGGSPVDIDFENGVFPRATYCVPEVASVGLTEEQAKERGFDVKVAKYPFAANAKANILNMPRGFTKIVHDPDAGVLGIHMIGPRVTELLAEAVVTVGWQALPADLAAMIHPHPTLSETMSEAAFMAIGRPFHG